jgi:hypothetical protein
MNVDDLAPLIRKYVTSTADDRLSVLCEAFDAMSDARIILNDVIACEEIHCCVLKLASSIQSRPHGLFEWKCLCFLASQNRYSRAGDIQAIFGVSSAWRPMLVHCGMIISHSREQEQLRHCFMFVGQFMVDNDVRREMVYAMLRGPLFGYFSERFTEAACPNQTQVLNVSAAIIDLFRAGSRKNDGVSFLRGGPLCTIKRTAWHVFSFGVKGSQVEMERLSAVTYALWSTLRIAGTVAAEQLVCLTDEMYKLSRNDMLRVNVIFHDILTSSRARELLHLPFDVTLAGYAYYLLDVLGLEALRSFLLYRHASDVNAKPTAVLMGELGLHSGIAWQENIIMCALRRFSEVVPEIAGILSALPPPPERVAKDRHCAFPGCDVVGTGLHNNMKKCGRCLSVYYCRKKHQEAHWPEHRLTCVKAASLAGDRQNADK